MNRFVLTNHQYNDFTVSPKSPLAGAATHVLTARWKVQRSPLTTLTNISTVRRPTVTAIALLWNCIIASEFGWDLNAIGRSAFHSFTDTLF